MLGRGPTGTFPHDLTGRELELARVREARATELEIMRKLKLRRVVDHRDM